MKVWHLRELLDGADDDRDILIQLPDNEPPVNFSGEWMEDLLVIFPLPHSPHTVWKHDTNVIESE